MKEEILKVRGAKEHNLKDVSVDIPKNKLVVITGLSGSGKSSLAFDTISTRSEFSYLNFAIQNFCHVFISKYLYIQGDF